MAANPASTDYVNKQIAAAKAQLVSQIASIPAVSHPVGSCYGGGVVFYVNTTPNAPEGQRGLIAALSDANGGNTIAWPCSSSINTSINLFEGATNTDNILVALPSTNSAAFVARTYNGAGYNDWYFPTISELGVMGMEYNFNPKLFQNCQGTGLSINNSYWSSSQYADNSAQAWYMNLNGVNYPNDKDISYLVRAIRAF